MSVDDPWGRVDPDGTVYVRGPQGERPVGQWPGGDPAEALALFRQRYTTLAVEVDLLEERVRAGRLGPGAAAEAVERLRGQVQDARAVGDLDGLRRRLSAVADVVSARREEARAERRRLLDEARTAKELIAEEAESLAAGENWRRGVDEFRDLLGRWQALPRLEDKGTDEALWHRFSAARTSYTRRRKHHFAEEHSRREEAATVKRRLVAEAEQHADSTEWRSTSARYRELMQRWRAAGPAQRKVEEELWQRFRQAQDRFFTAREAATAARDVELRANLEAKERLAAEAEALVPVREVTAAREALRALRTRWNDVGSVPRSAERPAESRLRKVEQAVRAAEEAQWHRSNPETRARVEATLAQLDRSIQDLEQSQAAAEARGDERAVAAAVEALGARRSWQEEVRRTLTDLL